jgi:hypothetical protein
MNAAILFASQLAFGELRDRDAYTAIGHLRLKDFVQEFAPGIW